MHKKRIISLLMALAMIVAGCTNPASSGSSGSSDSGGSSSPSAPGKGVVSLVFTDTDNAPGEIGGTVTIGIPSDESDITQYTLELSDTADGTGTVTSLAVLDKTGGDITYAIPANTVLGSNTHLLANSRNSAGSYSTAFSLEIQDVGSQLTVSFTDTDKDENEIGGDIVLTAPLDTTGIAKYNIYLAASASGKDQLLTSLGMAASPLSYTVADDTSMTGYTHITVFTEDGAGVEASECTSLLLSDYYILPPHAAVQSVSFTDTDDSENEIGGTISFVAPADDSDIDWYRIYLAQSLDGTDTLLTELTKVSGTTAHDLASDTPLGTNTHITVRTGNYGGEMSSGTSIALVDVYPHLPEATAGSISFVDEDRHTAQLGGFIKIQAAADESSLTHYNLYWGTDDSTTDGLIASVAKTGSDLTVELPLDTALGTHSHLIVNTKNDDGEMASGISMALTDRGAANWTIMVYLDGDNDLESYGISDLNEMEAADMDNSDVTLLVLMDRTPGYDTSNGNWTDTRLFKVMEDHTSTIASWRLSSTELGLTDSSSTELNMGDSATLENFVDYGKSAFPADNYMTVLWNHGGGWRSSNGGGMTSQTNPLGMNQDSLLSAPKDIKPVFDGITKDVCWDDTSSDILYNREVKTALAGKGIDILGFDACLMGMAEVAYEFKDSADFMVASPDTEPGNGWDYTGWLERFDLSPRTTADLYQTAVDSYGAFYASTAGTTLAVYDLSQMDALFTQIEAFASNFHNDLYNSAHELRGQAIFNTVNTLAESYRSATFLHPDLWDMADKLNYTSSAAVKTAVENTVVYEWHNGAGTINTGNPDSHGMGIYFCSFDSEGYAALATDYIQNDVTDFTTVSAYPGVLLEWLTFPGFRWLAPDDNEFVGISASADATTDTSEYVILQVYAETAGTAQLTISEPGGSIAARYYPSIAALKAGNMYTYQSGVGDNVNAQVTMEQGWNFVIVYNFTTSIAVPEITISPTTATIF